MSDEGSLDGLDKELGPILDTMPERRARERKAKLRDDGRSSRTAQPFRELNVKIHPELKTRIVAFCRRNDILIRDFVTECLEKGLGDNK